MIIANSDNKHKPQTPSQKRILEAKKFFTKALKSKELAQLQKIFEAMQKAQIIKLEFSNKKDSVLMFELQNNRGKDLTNMEKLKSYLAYQIYTYSDKDSAETKLDEMTSVFKEIYRVVNDVVNDIKQLNEDAILGYFNIATSKFGFAYREDDNSLNYKKELKDIKDSEEKLAWIDKYVKSLKDAFFDFKTFMKSKSDYKEYLLHLNVAATYPFVIKAYRLFRDDEEKLERVFKALEVIAFRDKLVSTRAKIRDKLNSALKNFDSVENLESGIKYVCDNEWYWNDDNIIKALEPEKHTLNEIARYIFMRYENALRSKTAKTKGYKFTLDEIKKPQDGKNPPIEHIAPQTENGEKVASGYCKYNEKFMKSYLNRIGNLMLIADSHNVSVGNNPFTDKLQSYEKSPMAQHREIKEFANGKIWEKILLMIATKS
ncbi:HNH endonuclease family protein [Helicobacter equorum]|uniref:HNH endonuclease family protein n=1 Tax=Helicobacter equorum TaxID=361872 RepID=UPI001F429D6A|nr:HNH endonuclease family protein [Helicobacter equorum]